MNEQSIPSPFVKKDEKEVLKKYFKDNDELLIAMRAVMLDLSPSDEDKKLVTETFANDELYKAIEYRFLPRLSKDVPIGQVQDIWLGIDQQITGQPVETISQVVQLNEYSIALVEQALKRLQNPDIPLVIDLQSLDTDPLQTRLLGRNRFIRAIETQLLTLKTLANQTEAPADASSKNSNR